MTGSPHILRAIRRFRRRERGAVLVEFALAFPLMFLFFGVIVEGTRMMYAYQMAIEGVREANRYLARTAPVDICLPPQGSLASYTSMLKQIVEEDISNYFLFPSDITVDSVTPTLTCVSGTYRTDPAPIASVSANVTISFPLGEIFGLFNHGITSVTTTITDSTRIYGT